MTANFPADPSHPPPLADLPAQLAALTAENQQLKQEITKQTRIVKRMQESLDRAKIIAAANAAIDATRNSEQSMRNKYMNMLLMYSHDIIILLDRDDNITYCSDMFLRKLGLASSEITKIGFREVFKMYSDATWLDRAENVFYASGHHIAGSFVEKIDLARTGDIRDYLINYAPALDLNSEYEGGVLFFQDVTVINHAREIAERASLSKSDFLANMSHEIRTPMNAILGMIAVMRRSTSEEHRRLCLNKLEAASNHLLNIINDILDMSKIEAKKFTLSAVEFNLEEMLRRIVELSTPKINSKKQVFTVDIDPELPENFFGDDQRLAQVIINLLSNATKFTPEKGSLELRVKQMIREDQICCVKITVADSGIGISDEQQRLLFNAFTQAEQNTTRRFGGTGLGLVISKQIVQMMGGKIWIESKIGEGARFIFTVNLPYIDRRETAAAVSFNSNQMRLLLITDTPNLRSNFKEIARQLNLNCDSAATAAQAAEWHQKHDNYIAALIDLEMSADWREIVKAIPDFGGAFIALTSFENWLATEKIAAEFGCKSFLTKPLFKSDLAALLTQKINGGEELSAEKDSAFANFAGKRILVAEDLDINRDVFAEMLEPTEVEIEFAEDGEVAVQKFLETPDKFGIIFMDLQMPKLDGFGATVQIRNSGLAAARTVPIIALSANVFVEDIDKCIAHGMNGHLAKPIDFDKLLKTMSQYLD